MVLWQTLWDVFPDWFNLGLSEPSFWTKLNYPREQSEQSDQKYKSTTEVHGKALFSRSKTCKNTVVNTVENNVRFWAMSRLFKDKRSFIQVCLIEQVCWNCECGCSAWMWFGLRWLHARNQRKTVRAWAIYRYYPNFNIGILGGWGPKWVPLRGGP